MSQDTMKSSPRCVSRAGEVLDGYGDQLRDPMARRETLALVRTFYTIESQSFENVFRKWLNPLQPRCRTNNLGSISTDRLWAG